MTAKSDMSTEDENKEKKTSFGSRDIPPFAFQAQNANVANTGITPFPVGTNLVLSASGLTAPRTVTYPDVSGQADVISATQTLTNKTVDAGLNTLSQVWQSPMVVRYGEMQPVQTAATTASQGISGALQQMTHIGSVSIVPAWDTVNGLFLAYTSGAAGNAEGGVRWSAGVSGNNAFGVTRTNFATRMRALIKGSQTANTRFYFGFTSLTSAAAVPISDAPLGTTDLGVLLGFSFNVASGVWNTYNNDGSGAEVIVATTGTTASDTNWHTLEINWANGGVGGINCIIDGHAQPAITTRIPATSTNLYPYCSGQSGGTASSIVMNIAAIQLEVNG